MDEKGRAADQVVQELRAEIEKTQDSGDIVLRVIPHKGKP